MRELALDPVGLAAHLVEPGASGGAGGMRAVLAAPAQHMQRLPERGDRHRLGAVIAPGEQVLMVAGDAVQRPQHLDQSRSAAPKIRSQVVLRSPDSATDSRYSDTGPAS